MNYRVLVKGQSFPFNNYSEAWQFKNANGGTLYEKCFSAEFKNN